MDATSMHTNVHVKHALPTIKEFLTDSTQGKEICKITKCWTNALVAAIKIVMEHNVFQCGDTFWLQLAGTTMRAAPAPKWATFYFAIWEITVIKNFPELNYYCLMMGWVYGRQYAPLLIASDGKNSKLKFTGRCKPLEWTFSKSCKSAIFLDLDISLLENGNICTRIYKKPMNLYSYLPSGSCHSPGLLKGLIH
eukprot:6589536-Ditylum_brightwellii.AAC.1